VTSTHNSPPPGLEMRLDNDATHLADAQSRREETAKQGKRAFSGTPRTPAEGHSPSALPIYEWISGLASSFSYGYLNLT
jgi:hypothetical protein